LSRVTQDSVSAPIFKEALTGTLVRLNPVFGSRDVVIATPQHLDGLQYHAVILAGLDSKSMMTTTTLSGDEQVLSRFGMGRYSGKSEREIEKSISKRNQYIEASLIRSASKHLSLVFMTDNDDGQELQPSGFLEEIVSQFQREKEGFAHALKRLTKKERHYRWNSKKVIDHITGLSKASAIAEVEVANRGEIIIDIEQDIALPILDIQTYARCPYLWFLGSRVGGIRFDVEFSNATLGSHVHKVLQLFFETWKSTDGGPITDVKLSSAQELLAQILERYDKELQEPLSTSNPDAWIRLKDYVNTVIDSEPAFNERLDNTMRPSVFESSIGKEDVVKIGQAQVSMRIDRIDTSGEAYFITDYKTEAKDSLNALIKKREIQIALYLLALEDLSKRDDSELARELVGKVPAGAVYRSYRTGQQRGFVDTSIVSDSLKKDGPDTERDESYLAYMQEIRSIATDAVQGILSGKIAPQMAEDIENDCRWCPAIRCEFRVEGYRA
jgi:RecB family exonuclease